VDYDLYVHGGGSCSSCILSSTSGAGVSETIDLRWDDNLAASDTRTVFVEIRFAGGSTRDCGGWTLTVNGNVAVASATC
jgi:hypothetical protein